MKYVYLLILHGLLLTSTLNAQDGELLFDNSDVHEIKINFDEDDFWQILTDNYTNSLNGEGVPTDVPYLMGNVIIDGTTVDSIGIRQKGFSSYFLFSNDYKKSLKLDFNEFVSGKKYDGLKKVNMTNGVGDPAMQRDFLAYNMMREAGIKAPRTSYAKVFLNDEYWGLYLLVEQVDKTFLKNNFEDKTGDLYKNIGFSTLSWEGDDRENYEATIELKTNKQTSDFSDFIEFVDILNNTSDADFADAITTVFNVDYYLRVLALDIMTDNWDSYVDHGRNFYLYHEPTSGQFHWIPWDYNFALNGNQGFSDVDDLPDNPADCASIQNGSSPYPATDPFFLQVISTKATCCTDGWDQSCQGIYNEIAGIVNEDLPEDFADCQTIINGSCPYPATDPVFSAVINVQTTCCTDTWDFQCQAIYNIVAVEFQPKYHDFPLVLENEDAILVNRIMAVPAFKEQYLAYCCEILDNNFSADRLEPIIDYNANLIAEAVMLDDNYVYNQAEFQYDISEGDNSHRIPSLKEFINRRIPILEVDLMTLDYNCGVSSNTAIDTEVLNVDMYPNPANDYFIIDVQLADKAQSVDIKIWNMLGQNVYAESHENTSEISILVNNWMVGLYTVEVKNGNARKLSKLVKK